jgi:hypothetical protein
LLCRTLYSYLKLLLLLLLLLLSLLSLLLLLLLLMPQGSPRFLPKMAPAQWSISSAFLPCAVVAAARKRLQCSVDV